MRYKYTVLDNGTIQRVQYHSGNMRKEYVFTKDGIPSLIANQSYQTFKIPEGGKTLKDYILVKSGPAHLLYIPETSPLFNMDFLSNRPDYSKAISKRLQLPRIYKLLELIRKQIKKELGV